MEARQADIGRIEPRIAEAVGDPDLAVEGTRAIKSVMAVTEVEVASMLARVEGDVARLTEEADAIARSRVSDQREQLGAVRRDLARKAVAVVSGFEELLSLLDEADARMAVRSAEGVAPAAATATPVAGGPEGGRVPHLRLAESPPGEDVGEADGVDLAAGPNADGGPRRRWWRRWWRQAA